MTLFDNVAGFAIFFCAVCWTCISFLNVITADFQLLRFTRECVCVCVFVSFISTDFILSIQVLKHATISLLLKSNSVKGGEFVLLFVVFCTLWRRPTSTLTAFTCLEEENFDKKTANITSNVR